MKSYPFIKLFFIILFLAWSPKVFALAGFSELKSVLRYNNLADISWFHPGDGCSPYGYNCFYLIEKNKTDHLLNTPLRKINIPKDKNSYFVFMESMKDQWIIYDLRSQKVVFESDNLELAFRKWNDLDLPSVEFADTANLSDYFQETEESKGKNKIDGSEIFFLLLGIIFYLHWKFWLVISIAFLCILGVYIHERRCSLFYDK